MVERPNKPKGLGVATPGLPPQAIVTFSDDNSRVRAELPTGESVEVLLHGATVISWKDAAGDEKLWLSSAAKLDGSKAVRGGIPLVFPVFGTAPGHEQTKQLPQHGFARTSRWEFLGKSTSESALASGGANVKLDFGLSSAAAGLDPLVRERWPFAFNLIYSVTLTRDSLATGLVVTNDGEKPFDCQVLFHTYLRVDDISTVTITGLSSTPYLDKLLPAGTTSTPHPDPLTITGETDRVYTPSSPSAEVVVSDAEGPKFRVTRDNLTDVVVWNPWIEKAKGMGDFEPKDGYKQMLCIEPGSVSGWTTLEQGDAFEGQQVITLL